MDVLDAPVALRTPGGNYGVRRGTAERMARSKSSGASWNGDGDGRRGGRVGELKVELVLVVPLWGEKNGARHEGVRRGERKREDHELVAETYRGGRI